MTYSSWVVEKNFIKRLLQEYKLVSYSASAAIKNTIDRVA